jgi:hypothetical protein
MKVQLQSLQTESIVDIRVAASGDSATEQMMIAPHLLLASTPETHGSEFNDEGQSVTLKLTAFEWYVHGTSYKYRYTPRISYLSLVIFLLALIGKSQFIFTNKACR